LTVEKVPIKKLRDVYPEMSKYFKYIEELCGGSEDFCLRYLDDSMFSDLVDINETTTKALLTYYKIECGQVIEPNTNIPLEELLSQYIGRLKFKIENIQRNLSS